MQYYERIKEMRINAGLTQEQIGEILGVKQSQYHRWESGKRDYPIGTIIRLAEYFGVSTDYILLGRSETNEEAAR